jgi:hypothetical protein
MRMRFASELERLAHRTAGGEYAWRREDACNAARALALTGRAILGGELWLVQRGQIWGALPQHSGPPAVYHWECDRQPSEAWASFVERSSTESIAAINAMPSAGEVNAPNGAEVYYNLTWVTEEE